MENEKFYPFMFIKVQNIPAISVEKNIQIKGALDNMYSKFMMLQKDVWYNLIGN